MTFQNESVELGSGLVFCCDIHGKIPKEQVDDFHPKQRLEQTSKQKYDAKRRQKRQYKCKDCSFTFQGSASWQQAAEHEREWRHIVTQGPDGKLVSWASRSVLS